MRTETWIAALLGLALAVSAGAEAVTITGTVVDAEGRPLADLDVSVDWSMDEGDFLGVDGGTTDETGAFELELEELPPGTVSVMALDTEKKLGGRVELDKGDAGKPVKITAGAAGHVHGKLSCKQEGYMPPQTQVYALSPTGAQVATSSSSVGGFGFLLPAGEYSLWAIGSGLVSLSKEVTVPATGGEQDLGTLVLDPSTITQHIGKPAPAWNVTHARGGAEPGVKIEDYRGKWLLVDFWGYW